MQELQEPETTTSTTTTTTTSWVTKVPFAPDSIFQRYFPEEASSATSSNQSQYSFEDSLSSRPLCPTSRSSSKKKKKKKEVISIERHDDDPSVWIETYRDENGTKKKRVHKPPPKNMTAMQRLGLASCKQTEEANSNNNKNGLLGCLSPSSAASSSSSSASYSSSYSPSPSSPPRSQDTTASSSSFKDISSATTEKWNNLERNRKQRRDDDSTDFHAPFLLNHGNEAPSLLPAAWSNQQPQQQREEEAEGEDRFHLVVRSKNTATHTTRWVTLEETSHCNIECANGSVMPSDSEQQEDLRPSGNRSDCVVCASGAPKTYLAVPCFHFAFCDGCVKRMRENHVKCCPICGMNNVSFRRVR